MAKFTCLWFTLSISLLTVLAIPEQHKSHRSFRFFGSSYPQRPFNWWAPKQLEIPQPFLTWPLGNPLEQWRMGLPVQAMPTGKQPQQKLLQSSPTAGVSNAWLGNALEQWRSRQQSLPQQKALQSPVGGAYTFPPKIKQRLEQESAFLSGLQQSRPFSFGSVPEYKAAETMNFPSWMPQPWSSSGKMSTSVPLWLQWMSRRSKTTTTAPVIPTESVEPVESTPISAEATTPATSEPIVEWATAKSTAVETMTPT